ncbi:hypothetical protein GINT2_001421 [Glugoides intestinalis]
MLVDAIQKLEELLVQIHEDVVTDSICSKDKLLHEAEKMYSFNALGICLVKLGASKDSSDYKEGLMKTKEYFKKIKALDM